MEPSDRLSDAQQEMFVAMSANFISAWRPIVAAFPEIAKHKRLIQAIHYSGWFGGATEGFNQLELKYPGILD